MVEQTKLSVKKYKQFLFFLFTFTLLLFGFWNVYAANSLDSNYIYFDLSLGNVTITPTKYTGYRYNASGTKITVSGTHTANNQYYVYQSSGSNGYNKLPVYSRVKHPTDSTKTWADYIKNHPGKSSAGADSVDEVIVAWGEVANKGTKVTKGIAYTSANRQPTPYYVSIQGQKNQTFNVTVDNI